MRLSNAWLSTFTVALLVTVGHAQTAAEHAADSHELREQVTQLQQQVQELQEQRDALAEELVLLELTLEEAMLLADVYFGDLHDPELAGLAAIEAARTKLDRVQRIEFLSQVLRDINDPQVLRNAAFVALIEALHENDVGPESNAETAALLRQMIRENARRWSPAVEEPWVGERLQAARERRRAPIVIYRQPGRILRDLQRHRFDRLDPFRRDPFGRRDLHHVPRFPHTHPLWRR